MPRLIKNPLIEKRAQLLLSLTLVQYLILYTVVVIVIILFPSILGFSMREFPLQEQFKASREFLFLQRRVVPVLIAAMIVEVIHYLYITNRIFGPLYRFNRVLAAWAEGSWPERFRIRKKDYHAELFKTFNSAAETIGSDLLRARDLMASSRDVIGKISADGPREDTASRLKEAEEKQRQALALLEKYFPAGEEE